MSCGQNICSMCGGASTPQPNYQKQVDPPIRPYGTILGDDPSPCGKRGNYRGGVTAPMQICLPTMACPPPQLPPGRHNPGQQPCVVQVPKDPARECPKLICDPCPPPPPTKVWLIKSSPVPQKSACLPIGGTPGQGCSEPPKMMICLPCPPPICPGGQQRKQEKKGPIGLVTHCKDLDLVGGKIISSCFCGMRNGLGAESCPRISCQNNPGCFMSPPMCWPKYEEEKALVLRARPGRDATAIATTATKKPIVVKCSQMSRGQEDSYPFAVPRKVSEDDPCRTRSLPPPTKRKCSPNCIHVTDLKGERECTYHRGIPCPADCFSTPIIPPSRG